MESNFNILKSKWLFTIVGVLVFIGLFSTNFVQGETRLWKEIWNLGHLFGFFIIWLFMLNRYPAFYPDSFKRVGLVILVMLAASIVIEVIQHFIGRSASIWDIGLNLAGTLIALSVVIYGHKTFQGRSYGIVIMFILISSVFTWPTAKIFIDEVYVARQFPVLSDFTTPFELSRWRKKSAEITLVKENNLMVLDIVLLPESKYASVALSSFGKSWGKYSNLVIELHNTMAFDIPLELRLHDNQHKDNGNQFSDRYNKSIILTPGHSRIIVPLIDLYHSPKNRKMDINNIESMMLFVVDLEQKKRFRIIRVYLQ